MSGFWSSPIVRIGLIILLIGLLDVYTFRGIKTLISSLSPFWRRSISWSYLGLHLLFWGTLVYLGVTFSTGGRPPIMVLRAFSIAVVLMYLPKLFFIVPLLIEDGVRIARAGGVAALKWMAIVPQETPVWAERRKFVSMLSMAIATIPFSGILHGVTVGKYNFTVRRKTLHFPDLPTEFDGFTITQISDIHVGSFDDPEAVRKGIELVNAQKSDLLVFTGDMVNNEAKEMEPWKSDFAKLKAPYGKLSVFGNHDYGDYIAWPSHEAKAQNLKRLAEIHGELGFRLLRNEHQVIEKNGQQLAVAGVENWGQPPFPQFGDLDRAIEGLPADVFTVLLSHDPTHWDEKTRHHTHPFALTLAGHTHGMQMGIEIPGFRWSPVKLRYPRWADLYQEAGRMLYVNRGFGYLGFPGRVGIWPEITVLELRKGTAVV